MNYKNILVTGGAGFVGSHICLKLKEYDPTLNVTVLDNLYRKGSELNVPRLKKRGITFIKGDIRNKKDLEIKNVDLLIECSAEPSVMAGVTSSPEYLLDTNLVGAIHCFELARRNNADVVFLSTSRVYPIKKLNSLLFTENETRFILNSNQEIQGASKNGISEKFPLDGPRSLYGTTKLSAELLLQEYIDNYKIKGVINRCGLITGPWQMGKAEQGIIAYWISRHIFNLPLAYIGYGGKGKQVRDILHVNDVFDLVFMQMKNMKLFNGDIFNVGGGKKNSISLFELTQYCQQITHTKIPIKKVIKTHGVDVRIYISDNKKIMEKTKWEPKYGVYDILQEIYEWISKNKKELGPIFT